jgi:hypothetical protein
MEVELSSLEGTTLDIDIEDPRNTLDLSEAPERTIQKPFASKRNINIRFAGEDDYRSSPVSMYGGQYAEQFAYHQLYRQQNDIRHCKSAIRYSI